MKIFVKAKTRAKEEKVQKIDDAYFLVYTRAVPQKGKANEAILKNLADYFKISKDKIKLISGVYSRNKIFEVKNKN